MQRNALLCSIACLILVPNLASAQFVQGDWALSLSGTGSNDKDFRSYDLAAAAGVSYFVSDALELGVRQTIVSADGGSAFSGATRGAIDYNINLGRWVPFVGGSIGYRYGDNIDDSWIAGPEVGIRFFANTTTFIQVNAGYDFDLNEGLDSGGFVYGLGIGFRF